MSVLFFLFLYLYMSLIVFSCTICLFIDFFNYHYSFLWDFCIFLCILLIFTWNLLVFMHPIGLFINLFCLFLSSTPKIPITKFQLMFNPNPTSSSDVSCRSALTLQLHRKCSQTLWFFCCCLFCLVLRLYVLFS